MKTIKQILYGKNGQITDEKPPSRFLNLYALIDEKAKTIVGPVVHAVSPVPATREVEEQINKPGNILSQHPDDFAFYHLGVIDETNGKIHAFDEPELVFRAVVLKHENP